MTDVRGGGWTEMQSLRYVPKISLAFQRILGSWECFIICSTLTAQLQSKSRLISTVWKFKLCFWQFLHWQVCVLCQVSAAKINDCISFKSQRLNSALNTLQLQSHGHCYCQPRNVREAAHGQVPSSLDLFARNPRRCCFFGLLQLSHSIQQLSTIRLCTVSSTDDFLVVVLRTTFAVAPSVWWKHIGKFRTSECILQLPQP